MNIATRFGITLLCAATLLSAAQAARLAVPKVAPLQTWRELQAPHQIWPYGGAIYYSFKVNDASRGHLVVVNLRDRRWTFRPFVTEKGTAPTSEIAISQDASAAINGGYFNLKDSGASTSYVTIDGALVADPNTNKALIENPKLKAFMPQILNRTEVRFLKDNTGNNLIQFAKHAASLPAGATLVHALQAGPRLLPTLDATEEAFYRTEPDGAVTDAISSRRPAARTAFGITPDGYALLLCVSGNGQDPESTGVTLDELAAAMKRLGCCEAINFDGGASSTMYVRLGTAGAARDQKPAGAVVCGKNPETRVKSVLMLMPTGTAADMHRILRRK